LQQLTYLLIYPLGYILNFAYILTGNFSAALFLFALISKLITFPLTLVAQKNSIRLIQLQPELEHIKRVHFGDNNRINEEQYKLYKRER